MISATITPISFDPFPGEERDPVFKLLSDSMVKGRGKYSCLHCLGVIAVGEIHRNRNERVQGRFMSFRWCALCCAAMVEQLQALLGDPNHDAFDRRSHWQREGQPC